MRDLGLAAHEVPDALRAVLKASRCRTVPMPQDQGFGTQGADTELPFECPADHFIPMKHLDNVTEVDIPYRMTGFLSVYEQVRTPRHEAAYWLLCGPRFDAGGDC